MTPGLNRFKPRTFAFGRNTGPLVIGLSWQNLRGSISPGGIMAPFQEQDLLFRGMDQLFDRGHKSVLPSPAQGSCELLRDPGPEPIKAEEPNRLNRLRGDPIRSNQ